MLIRVPLTRCSGFVDYALTPQFGDLLRSQSRVFQHLLRVFAQQWRWPLGLNVGVAKTHGYVHGGVVAQLRVANLWKHA